MDFVVNSLINICLFIWYRIIGGVFRILPIQNNKIVFSNFFGKGYGESPKYIAEELLNNETIKLKMIWIIKGKIGDDFPLGIQVVKRWRLSELYNLATAKIWVDDSRKHFGIKKRKKQYYIQTWHGSIGPKIVEKELNPNIWYRASAVNDSKMIDVLLSGSKWQTDSYRRNFWYEGKILEIGMPKNDFWARAVERKDELKSFVYKKFNLSQTKKIALYAPTFRKSDSINAYDLDYNRLISSLERYIGGEWVVMIRLHPNISKEAINIDYNEKIINASKYSDINELILASELVISDYSSCLYDAVYIEKPSLIYASDREQYEKNYGFALKLEDSPASIAENNDEMEQIIKEFDIPQYVEKCKRFSEKYGIIHSVNSSKKVAELILKVIEGNEIIYEYYNIT